MGDEFARIARYFAPLAGPEGLGLLDDAAIFTSPAGCQLVLTVDQMLEGVHFLPDDAPDLVARKLLRRNLSDLAAMGAKACGYLLTTALPAALDARWVEAFAKGLKQDQEEFNLCLFGGDSSSTLGPIALSATLIGHVAPGKALRRSGAVAGDEIWVTGTIGDAALGLQARQGTLVDASGFLSQRALLPSPRMGLQLEDIAHAAIDVSDGLVQDLGHICQASGLGATIWAASVPASAPAAALGGAHLETRLTGGDDYELLLAVPKEKAAALRAACTLVPVTRIGVLRDGAKGVTVLDEQGQELKFSQAGWKHF